MYIISFGTLQILHINFFFHFNCKFLTVSSSTFLATSGPFVFLYCIHFHTTTSILLCTFTMHFLYP